LRRHEDELPAKEDSNRLSCKTGSAVTPSTGTAPPSRFLEGSLGKEATDEGKESIYWRSVTQRPTTFRKENRIFCRGKTFKKEKDLCRKEGTRRRVLITRRPFERSRVARETID